jgi:sRNA-binding regulator protein Hfq
MEVQNKPLAKAKTKAPEATYEEARYLKQLIDRRAVVCVRTSSNEEFTGQVEFFDLNFIRLTRAGGPNIFLFKHDIKYLYESDSKA